MSITNSTQESTAKEWLSLVESKVKDLRYGLIQITVHDGRVTLIEKTEKTRLGNGRD